MLYLHEFMYTYACLEYPQTQRRASELLGLELKMVVHSHVGVEIKTQTVLSFRPLVSIPAVEGKTGKLLRSNESISF